ncbi:hypothetical protein GRJ2_002441100 [Grus japonensis]|uniref:Uncharacterized protein n=1 Tax=Grus japonensis TaxID=30415 RepID=A0ABC9XQQ6_GRUJA
MREPVPCRDQGWHRNCNFLSQASLPQPSSPPARAPVQAQEVRSSVLEPQLPCRQSQASAVQSKQACHAGTLAKPGPAQVLRHEVSSPERTPSQVVDRGQRDTASLSSAAGG